MVTNRWYVFIATLIFVCGSIIGHAPSSTLRTRALDTAIPVASTINTACVNYLQEKGISNIVLKTSENTTFFGHDDAYAFTLPDLAKYRSTVFISPGMLESIKRNLDNNQPIAIYDKFTLLHELGHLHPYGYEYERHAHEAAVRGASGLCGLSVSAAGLALCEDETAQTCFSITSLLSLGVLGSAVYTYYTKVRSILRTFKKYTFTHADKKIEQHVKQSCEERDADLFALALFSTQELNELHTYYANLIRDYEIIVDENGYHPTPQERCAMIKAELEKRNV